MLGGEVVQQVCGGAGAGDQQYVGCQLQQPLQCDLRRGDAKAGSCLDDRRAGEHRVGRAAWQAERAERHEGDSATDALLEDRGRAIAGAFVLPQIRARLSANALVVAASVLYAAALAVVALSRNLALTVLALLPAGAAWIAFLSNINAALQLFLPQWVRARALSVYQMVLFGGQAAGAVIWGVLAAFAGMKVDAPT